MEKPKDGKGMDVKLVRKEIADCEKLAKKLSYHIGTFDHYDMTLDELAAYGVKKLGLKCKKGHESSILDGYLAASKVDAQATIGAMDSMETPSSSVDAYISKAIQGGK
jgi:hypothetical protein